MTQKTSQRKSPRGSRTVRDSDPISPEGGAEPVLRFLAGGWQRVLTTKPGHSKRSRLWVIRRRGLCILVQDGLYSGFELSA